MAKRRFPPATIDTVIAEITHAADAGGANEARCLQWVSDLTALRAKGQEETPPLNEPFGNSEQLAEPVSTAYTLPEAKGVAAGVDEESALASAPPSAPVGSSVYAALRSIRYNAENGSQDRPLHVRLQLIAEDARRAIAACEAAPQPAAVDEAMRAVAAIAHSGGLIGLEEDEALTAIRRLSLPYWQKEEKPEQVHAAIAAPQQAAGANEAPDPSLLRFYGVEDYPSLVAALEAHVLKLIDTHKRNVKPWEDTFPPTLLPRWVREQGVVPTDEGLALAQKWEDEAAESWGEDDAHRAKQECCDELRGLLTAALAAQQQGGRADG